MAAEKGVSVEEFRAERAGIPLERWKAMDRDERRDARDAKMAEVPYEEWRTFDKSVRREKLKAAFEKRRDARDAKMAAEKGVSVGNYNRLSRKLRQEGEIRHFHNRFFVKGNILAVVIFYKTGLYGVVGCIGRCIKMGNKSDNGKVLCGVRLQRGVNVAVFVYGHVGKTERRHFLRKILCQSELLVGGGTFVCRLVGCGGEGNVFK
jgi:hypothetical protein